MFEFACPKCNAPPHACGKGGRDACEYGSSPCEGFICECDPFECPESEKEDHGVTLENPCHAANCYHCGWGGKHPKAPKGLGEEGFGSGLDDARVSQAGVGTMKPGTRVKMSKQLKENLKSVHSIDHLREFGDCVGIVQGPVDWGDGEFGPEVDVRWLPSGLRYAYDPLLLDLA